jgi:hypothetical protein
MNLRQAAPTLGLLTLLLAPVRPAHADDEELTQASKQVFREAIAAYDKNDWAVCRTKAIGVWQQIKNPKVAGLLGMCESELGLNRDAAEHLDFFFKKAKDAPPDQLKAAQARFDKVKAKIATVTLVPTPPDADVLVDGKILGKGQTTLFVEPGDRLLAASKNGQEKGRTVTLSPGDTRTIQIEVPFDAAAGGGGAGAGGAGAGGTGAGGSGAGGAGGTGEGEASLVPAIALGVAGGVLLLGGIGASIGAVVTRGSAEDDLGSTLCPGGGAVCEDVESKLDTANILWGVGIAGMVAGAAALTGMVIVLALPGDSDVQVRASGSFLSLEGSF